MHLVSARAVERMRAGWWDAVRPRARAPIFVIGCPRSGASLLYRALSGAPALGGLGRDGPAYWDTLHPCAERQWRTHALDAAQAGPTDRERVTREYFIRTGGSRWVDMNAHAGLAVRYLDALFPDAHFVYVKRAPYATLRSLMLGWSLPERFGAWSAELPVKVRIDAGRYRRWCFFLAAGWQDYVSAPLPEVCAFQYRAINAAILDARAGIPAERWTELRYEDVLREPETYFGRVARDCQVRMDARLRQHLDALQRHVVAQAEARSFPGAKRAEDEQRIAEAMSLVADIAARMGYGAGELAA
jgi:hypothetical protein